VSAPVIAALDPVTEDLAPVRLGAAIAARMGARLYVASVHASDEAVERLAGGQLGEELPRESGDLLERTVAELRRVDGADAEPLALGATSVPRGLELAAQQLGAGLIVAGSARDSDPRRLTPGRTTLRLLTGASCAVAAVPWGWERFRGPAPFGAAFVATAEGRAALKAAHALADRAGARLRVLAAVRARSWMTTGTDEELGADLRLRAEQAAHAAASGLLGEPVDIDVVVGEPAETLIEASAELDLLVCGARGYGPVPAALLGGVTSRVIARAGCPVVVLARGAEPWRLP
jgi:nucleotide-binding universal stress UspA family protein